MQGPRESLKLNKFWGGGRERHKGEQATSHPSWHSRRRAIPRSIHAKKEKSVTDWKCKKSQNANLRCPYGIRNIGEGGGN